MQPRPFDLSYAIAKVRAAAAAFRLRHKLEEFRQKAGFRPDQPRVPAGSSDGGRWTDGGVSPPNSVRPLAAAQQSNTTRQTVVDRTGVEPWRRYAEQRRPDGTLLSRTIDNRDGSRIETTFPPHGLGAEINTVKLPDGGNVTFEHDGPSQRVFDGEGRLISHTVWTPNGPEPQPIVQLALADPRKILLQRAVQSARVLYNWWLSSREPSPGAPVPFLAFELKQGDFSENPAVHVGKRSREEVEKACRRFVDVQLITNAAAASVDRRRYPNAAIYGTEVHQRIRSKVNDQRDPNFRAEISIIKSNGEAIEQRYGSVGTIRIDVLENVDDNLVCVYDVKTGRRGLSNVRVLEILMTVSELYKGARRVIIIEVRPSR